jgi:NAD(P)-dependent dehydrogenase (short-subunit alcohol dehydrogenase family)
MPDHALVTGASTGIGRAAVKILTARGWRVFAGVRKAADADSLRQEFGEAVIPLLFDVTDTAAVRAAAAEIRAKLGGRTLKGLVNNAGMAVGGPLCWSRSTISAACLRSMCSAPSPSARR